MFENGNSAICSKGLWFWSMKGELQLITAHDAWACHWTPDHESCLIENDSIGSVHFAFIDTVAASGRDSVNEVSRIDDVPQELTQQPSRFLRISVARFLSLSKLIGNLTQALEFTGDKSTQAGISLLLLETLLVFDEG